MSEHTPDMTEKEFVSALKDDGYNTARAITQSVKNILNLKFKVEKSEPVLGEMFTEHTIVNEGMVLAQVQDGGTVDVAVHNDGEWTENALFEPSNQTIFYGWEIIRVGTQPLLEVNIPPTYIVSYQPGNPLWSYKCTICDKKVDGFSSEKTAEFWADAHEESHHKVVGR